MSIELRQAALQALEALEQLQGGCTDHDDGTVEAITVWCPEIIDALRAALSQQPATPEPVRLGALMALTAERDKLNAALELACSHLTKEQAEQVAAAMPSVSATPEPVASIYITPAGEREFDDWKCDLPVGRNILYTHPAPRVPDALSLLKSLGPKPWETSPEAHAQARLIGDFESAMLAAKEGGA